MPKCSILPFTVNNSTL
uniref:Histonelysine Nmethyltransferase SETMARlike [Bombus terrestris] n=1 Tax=Lepeophtheirus salmonis TaxID=72036 RepID=A0A0K2T5F2_LEPSM